MQRYNLDQLREMLIIYTPIIRYISFIILDGLLDAVNVIVI